ncbi:MAG: GNAT family N-acetyltransferase [Alphaproteobacteria bacterium]
MEIIFKIAKNSQEMKIAHDLIIKHYKHLNIDQTIFEETIDEMVKRNNYQMLLAFAKTADGLELLGIAGFWVSRMFYCGRYLQVSNLIVNEKFRSNGIGKKILQYLEIIALKQQCLKIVLDSYTENKRSHSLYFGEGFYIRGFHFVKDL